MNIITAPCPHCEKEMEYTGLPDIAGPVDFRFFHCPEHGLIKVYEEVSHSTE